MSLEKQMETKIAAQFEKLEKEQKARMLEFEQKMVTNIQTMIERINDTFHKQVKNQITQVHDTLSQNMKQIQTTILAQINTLRHSERFPTMLAPMPAPMAPPLT